MDRKKGKTMWYALAGAAAGVVNGFFGGGGGQVLVPMLAGKCGLDQRKAFATSVAVIAPLCALSAVVYWFRGQLDLALALPYLAGGLAGGFLGGKLFQKLSMTWLRRGFALLILSGGVKALLLKTGSLPPWRGRPPGCCPASGWEGAPCCSST